jgi:serine/threonine protein kinase
MMIGQTISHYKILEKLGEGGMGVVYKAEDTKLDRIVALKFLPSHLTANDTDKARFIQEAKAAAALNHPNVCVIHDIQEHDGQQFIVMEYVEGQTLRELSKSHGNVPIPTQDAINYATQIADALKAAHSKDIIHRDIKSENIMITSTGQIKVMDFGLAKLRGSVKLTKTSTTAGTLSYSSPEQIQGKEADARSDIFSFGVVLYEMLTGRLPFKGDYESALIYSILDEEPEPVQKFIPGVSSELIHIINRILEKDPENRYQSMKDVLIDLKRVKRDTEKTVTPIQKATFQEERTNVFRNKFKKYGLFSFVSIPVVIVIILVFFIIRQNQNQIESMNEIQVTNDPGDKIDPALSPAGDKIAYSWKKANQEHYHIYVKLIGEEEPAQLTESPGSDYSPRWSPDGSHIAFKRFYNKQNSIYRIPVIGGSERYLYSFNPDEINVEYYPSFDWSQDENTLVLSDYNSSLNTFCLYLYNTTLRTKEQITFPTAGFIGDLLPKFSADGKMLAFKRCLSFHSSELYVMHLKDRRENQLTFDKKDIRGLDWNSSSKEIIFSSDRSGANRLWRISISGGEPKPLIAGQSVSDFSVSRSKQKLAFVWGSGRNETRKIDLNASEEDILKTSALIPDGWWHQFSPDDKKIALEYNDRLCICDESGAHITPLITEEFRFDVPKWSPDGQWLACESITEGYCDIEIISTLGGQRRLLMHDKADDRTPSWSWDGKWIYFGSNRSGDWQIHKMPVEGGEPIQITREGGLFGYESFDGKWFYFTKMRDFNIWRLSFETGIKSKIIEGLTGWHAWKVTPKGIVFMRLEKENKFYCLELYNYISEKIEPMIRIKHDNDVLFFDISNDFKSALIRIDIYGDSNIGLVENFQ